MTPQECKTIKDLASLDVGQIDELSHIIVDKNGKCMCGTYDGRPMTCTDIRRLINNVAFMRPTESGLDEGEV